MKSLYVGLRRLSDVLCQFSACFSTSLIMDESGRSSQVAVSSQVFEGLGRVETYICGYEQQGKGSKWFGGWESSKRKLKRDARRLAPGDSGGKGVQALLYI